MTTRHTAGTYVLVPCGADALFLARALGEPRDGRLELEGRAFHPLAAPRGGGFAGTPFPTRVEFALDGGALLHEIDDSEAAGEAEELLASSSPRLTSARFPLLARWFEAALCDADEHAPSTASTFAPWIDSFERSAEEFRRTLLRSARATSSRELDRLTELEGDLVIELGKVANDVGVGLAKLAASDADLARFLDQWGDDGGAPAAGDARGWSFLSARLIRAKLMARARGRTALVRELNALLKDGLSRLCEIVLEHDHALDVLISETTASLAPRSESSELTPASPRKGREGAHLEPPPFRAGVSK